MTESRTASQATKPADKTSGIDPRSVPPKPRDIYMPDLHIDSIKLKTREFR